MPPTPLFLGGRHGKQFRLAPGFATTAHAAQGQTCKEGVVMDMHIGDTGDPLTAYIALLCVQDRHGLFVYRPFPAAPFQKGAKVGKELRRVADRKAATGGRGRCGRRRQQKPWPKARFSNTCVRIAISL